MTAYVDASVLLRIIFRAPEPLREWSRIDRFVASSLLRVECFRALHRLRITEPLSDEEFAYRGEFTERMLTRFQLISISEDVLVRACGSLASPLKTLDAIHLATASLWREREDASIFLATHDKQFGLAARMTGFRVLGL